MIRFALIVASTLGFVLTAALGNFMAPLLQELERFRPQEQQEPQTPVQSRVPALGGLCLMVSTLAAVGVGWTAACIAQPTLLGSESQLMTRLLIALFGAQAFGAIGLADDAARLRSRAQLGLRRLPRLALEAAAAAAVLVLLAVNGCLPTGLQLPGAGYVELGGAAPVHRLSGPSGWRMTPPACAAAHSLACGVCPALHWKPPLRQRCWCCWQ